jgi:anaerobic magnesium-protoporphyrin IX monomethyl ester cyclase
MKVLVVNPPFLPMYSRESRSPAVTKSGTLYFPMWLAYCVGYLEKNGHEVLFIDAPAAKVTHAQLIERATTFGPQLAVFQSSTPSIKNDIDVACAIKKAVPACTTMLVGVHVSAVPRETLQEALPGLDLVAVHEFDATVLELANRLSTSPAGDGLFSAIAGIAYKKADGSVVLNPDRPHIKALDDLPFVSSVYKKHLDINPYFYGHSRHPLIVIVTGRGCPFHCTYCVIPQTMHGHLYRKRSVESVVKEFQFIAENFPRAKEIMIEDDTLTADRQRCREFSQALIDAKATTIPWSANSRADVDFDTMHLMKKAGCRLFCVGFESGEQQILDNIKKGTSLEKIRKFVRDAHRAGILIHGCFMVGNRGETSQTLEKTLTLAKELNPDTAQFFPIMVYPGTSDWDYFKSKGWITTTDWRKWITAEGLHSSVVSNPDLTYDYLVNFCNRARREFYLRPKYVASKLLQILRSPGEAKRIFKGFSAIWRYLIRS